MKNLLIFFLSCLIFQGSFAQTRDLTGTREDVGDCDIELDFMLPTDARSAIYLQGRYEILLNDSWGTVNPTANDNGAVQGHAPRQSVSRAPGTWQHLKISFQAPRFDNSGHKTENARIISAELNGVTVQDNLELPTPAAGAIGEESAKGPLLASGAATFRNIKLTKYERRQQPAATSDSLVETVDPILIDAPVNTVLRSFMDIKGKRVVHAVSVGSPQGVHYTYDMDNAAIVQVWRGDFLDATPMWHERGDGSSRPRGTVQLFMPSVFLRKLESDNEQWKTDTAGTGLREKGYHLDASEKPTFRYLIYGTMVSDSISVAEKNAGLRRTITVSEPQQGLFARLAAGSEIEDQRNGLYLVDAKSYYIKVEDGGGAAPMIRESNGKKEIIIPVKTKLVYSILF